MKHEDEKAHDHERMEVVVTLTLATALDGAEREGLCPGCILRSVLSSVLLTLAGNEPDTEDEEFLDMVGGMLASTLVARRHLHRDEETLH